MSVTVKYFANLREIMGRSEDSIEVGNGMLTVEEVWAKVSGTHKSLPPGVLTSINMKYVKTNAAVRDGDEVAFFPPVTGG